MLLQRMGQSFPLGDIRREVGRLFEDFVGSGDGVVNRVRVFPALNVWEEDDTLFVEAEVPGLKMEDLEVTVVGDELTIKGQRNSTNVVCGRVLRQERNVGHFVRTVTLPYPVDSERVEATMRDGVLLIKLPKTEAAKPRRIEVRGS